MPDKGYWYFILSVHPGQLHVKPSWDFRLGAGAGASPLNYSNDTIEDTGIVMAPDCVAVMSSNSRLGSNSFEKGWWPWNIVKPGPMKAPPRNHVYSLPQALLTARAAELITPILEAHPELFAQVRAYALKPETLATLLMQIDTNADGFMTVRELIDSGFAAPFADILNFGAAGEDIDALPPIDLSTLTGDASFLFSYESLRILSSFYSKSDAVAKGLIRWLDSAQAAEGRGDTTARAVRSRASARRSRHRSARPSRTPRPARSSRSSARSERAAAFRTPHSPASAGTGSRRGCSPCRSRR